MWKTDQEAIVVVQAEIRVVALGKEKSERMRNTFQVKATELGDDLATASEGGRPRMALRLA